MKRALMVLAALMVSCTSEDGTRETLEKSGFSDIEVGGYAPFACAKGDAFQTKFTAKNPLGRRVEGVVCCGWLKDCTVRF